MPAQKRVLFVSEDVTLAQVVRLVTLARALDSEGVEVHFASSRFPELVFGATRFARHRIETLPADRAAKALRAGQRLYEKSALIAYIAAEVELIERVRPELVVGDFRWSVPASAELCGVPSAVLINAYWSPYAPERRFPVPDHPIVHFLGESLTEQYFPKALPRVFQHFADPLNAARRQYGLQPVGSLLEVLTHADYTLYPDHPWLTPVRAAPASHQFIGPVLWQPEVPSIDAGLLERAGDRPLIYVTLGSSGAAELLPMILGVLAKLPITAVVATADRVRLGELPANVIVSSFVRGSDVARHARLVISNGGSSTGYQALNEGTPVLGLPSNLDQYLATQAIVRSGAGSCVKARRASPEALRSAITGMLEDDASRDAARQLAVRFRSLDSASSFREFVQRTLALRAKSSAR